MDSKKFEILMTAVNLGSFSKASEVVGYTQSGLTHLINGLEREIGMKLIRRDHSGISLTEDGEALLPAIREYLSATAKLDHHAKADGDDPNRRLCEPCHALDAGNSVPLPPRVSGDRRGSSHGGPRARTL
jgi:DNA-binding transcriptional LysR family regulator